MANVSEMNLWTFSPSYQFSFKWTIYDYSKLPERWRKASEDFSIEPESSWYVEFEKSYSDIYLYLCRNDAKNFKVRCETLVLNGKEEILHKGISCYKNTDQVDLLRSFGEVLKDLPEDRAVFKISITVKCPEPSTVNENQTRSVLVSEASLNRLQTLSADLKKLFDNNVMTDVTFNIRGETLSAHKNILTARSDVFAKMFQEGMAEEENNTVVNVEDIDLSTMKILLSFMYSAELEECDLDMCLDVYRAADKYAVTGLKDACAHTLVSKMTSENACKILYIADMHHHWELKEKAIQFITVHHKSNHAELQEIS